MIEAYPRYIFDEQQLVNDVRSLQADLNNYNICFSVKTNNHPSVITALISVGLTPEVVSEFEYSLVRGLGYSGLIVVNGPIKNASWMKKVLYENSLIQVSSLHEIQLLRNIVGQHNKSLDIVLRVNPYMLHEEKKKSRFGLNLDERLFLEIQSSAKIRVVGLHFHWPERSLESFLFRERVVCQSIDLLKNYFSDIHVVNIGGGLPSASNEVLKSTQKEIISVLRNLSQTYSDMQFVMEPGTAIMADCFEYECKVLYVEKAGLTSIIQTNGSVYDCGRFRRNFEYEWLRGEKVLSRGVLQDADCADHYILAGSSCIEADVFGSIEAKEGSSVMPGDILRLKKVGSYSWVFKSNFITLLPPVFDKKSEQMLTSRPTSKSFLNYIGYQS